MELPATFELNSKHNTYIEYMIWTARFSSPSREFTFFTRKEGAVGYVSVQLCTRGRSIQVDAEGRAGWGVRQDDGHRWTYITLFSHICCIYYFIRLKSYFMGSCFSSLFFIGRQTSSKGLQIG